MSENIILKVDFEGADVTSKKAVALATNINKLGATKRDLNKQIKDLDVTSKTYAQDLQRLTASQNQVNTQIKVAKKEYADYERATINATVASRAQNGSLAQMRAQLASAQAQWVRMTVAQQQNSKEGIALKQRINELDAAVKGNEESIGIHNRSVGDYGKALNGLTPYLGQFGSQISMVQGLLGGISETLKKFGVGSAQTRTQVQGFGTATTNTSGAISGMTSSTQGATAATTAYNTVQQTTNGTVMQGRAVVTGYARSQQMAASSTQAATAATGGLSKVLRILKIALISTGLGAILVILGSLVAAVASTQKGMDGITKVTRPIKEVFATLFGIIQDIGIPAFKVLKGAFTAYINSFLWGYQQFKAGVLAMRIAWNEWTGDDLEAKELQKSLEEVNKEIAETENRIKEATKDVADGFTEMADVALSSADRISEAWDRGGVIDRLEKEIELIEVSQKKREAQLQLEIETQRRIRKNTALSAAERRRAEEKEIELTKEQRQIQIDLINKRLELAKLNTEANDTNREDLKEIADMEAEALLKQAELQKDITRISQEGNSMRKKAIADAQKARDEAAKKEVQNEIEAVDKKMALLDLERKLEIATNEETNEQRFQNEVDLQKRLFDLKIEKAKKEGKDTLLLEKEKQVALAQLKKSEADRIAEEEKAKKEKEAEKKKEDDDKAKAEAIKEQEAIEKAKQDLAFKFADELTGGLLDRAKRRQEEDKQREIDGLKAKLEAGVISQEEFDKQRLEIDKKAFQRKKRLDTAEILVNSLVAASKTIAQLGFVNPALPFALAGIGVQTAAQIAGVQAQTFADGGFTGEGVAPADHTGQRPVGIVHEREFVANRHALATPRGMSLATELNSINQNPALGYFADGGFTSRQIQIDEEGLANSLSMQMSQIKVVNVASETSAVDSRTKFVRNKGRI